MPRVETAAEIGERARNVAAAIVADHGAPLSPKALLSMLAYAYALGEREGFAACGEMVANINSPAGAAS